MPVLVLIVAGLCLPLFGDSYLGVIGTRACIYWVLVSGLNLVVGFAGQIAIGWVALLTLGAYVTSVLTAGTAVPELSPYLALLIAALFGAIFGLIVGLPALRLRTFYFAMTTLGLRDDRHADSAGLEERDRRRRRRARAGLPLAVLDPVGILLFLPRPRGDLHLDDNQRRGEPLRALTGGNPRRRGRSRGRRHLQAGPAGHGVPVQRGACRHRRRIVRVAAILHHARCLHLRPVGAVLHCHPDRRARVDPGAAARHDHPDRAARIRRAAGGLVHVSLCGAAAGDRAHRARRHRRDAGFQEPPAARAASPDTPAPRAAAARDGRKRSRKACFRSRTCR